MNFFQTFLLLWLVGPLLQAGGLAKLTIGDHALVVELATEPQEQVNGLMNRASLEADHGMLFIFPQPKQAYFWMHNTSIPLDVAFLDSKGMILEILPLVPFEEKRAVSKSSQVAYAIETSRDWFASRNIQAGDQVKGLPKN